jgi:DNA-binding HxlR family transcriptional regulator
MENDTDEYCQRIFIVLTLTNRKIRFNELHKQLRNYGLKMSKPTLILHLGHLLRQKTILRLQQDRQIVFYEINWKRLEQLRKAHQISQAALDYTTDEKTFNSKPLRHQINMTLDMLFLKELFMLKLSALYLLHPKERTPILSTISYIRTLYTVYARWLFKNIEKTEDKGEQLFKAIDETVDRLTTPFLKTNQEKPPKFVK